VSDIIGHWRYLVNLLKAQLSDHTPEPIIEQTRRRIRRFAEGADQQLAPLPKPDFEDPAFVGMCFEDERGPKGAVSPYEPLEPLPSEEARTLDLPSVCAEKVQLPPIRGEDDLLHARMEVERLLYAAQKQVKEYKRLANLLKQRNRRMLVAQQEGREYLPKGPFHKPGRKAYRPGPCWCGCGKMANLRLNGVGRPCGVNRFLQGHISRYLGLMLRVERGDIQREDLPEFLRRRINWVHCKLCRGWIPPVDPFGRRVEEQVGIACWRERRKVYWPYRTR
jgi:hypothetical protein